MSRNVWSRICLMMTTINLLSNFNLGSTLWAQYPALPIECIGNANYEWRPDLGGWRDKTTSLIWGYSVTATVNISATYGGVPTLASSYPQQLANKVPDLIQRAELQEARAALETDPVRIQGRLNLAATFRADAASTSLAAADAARFSNWRAPTLKEFQAAWNKGFFTRGAGAFNYDQTPFNGYQVGYTTFHWTSDPAVRSNRLATLFNLGDGGNGLFGVNSTASVIVVRNGQ